MSPHPLHGVVGLVALLLIRGACADWSGSATLVSDYRFRGISLSDEKPAAQLSVAYDHPLGWYAGLFASTTQFAYQSGRNPQVLSYLGYARRLDSRLAWEAGAAYSAFGGYHDYDYPEIYAGIASDALSARIHFAPDYFGQGKQTIYAELNGSLALAGPFRLVGHVGGLHSDHGGVEDGASHNQYDARVGVAINLDRTRIELTAVRANVDSAIYPVNAGQRRSALVLGASYSF